MKALSIRPIWAWLIVNRYKDVENRNWKTTYRGPIAVHASGTMSRDDYNAALEAVELACAFSTEQILVPAFEDLQRGGIVGTVDIVGCVDKTPSPWFYGEYGFLLENAKPLPFHPCKGKLGFFEVELPSSILPTPQK